MHDSITLLFIVSIMLVIVSALSLNTLYRLKKASDNYVDKDVFESSCRVSVTYTNGSLFIISLVFVFALVLLAIVLFKERVLT